MTPIRIVVGPLVLEGELDASELSSRLLATMPIEGKLCSFGDSFYVETDVDHDAGTEGTDVVDVGDIGYWHPALALQFFFGATPESPRGSTRPVPAGEVARIGTFRDPLRLGDVRGEHRIRVERA